MRSIPALLAGSLLMMSPAGADPLSASLWQHRPVVIVAPDPGDVRLRTQRRLLDAKAATLRGYDIRVVTVTGDDPARARWHVPLDEFATILVGKDGGEKARWSSPVEPAKIFALIDEMPMRREEVGRR